MIPTTVQQIAEAVGGTLHDGAEGGALVTAPASVDSRNVQPGGLFVALAGERVDGRDYAGVAVNERGAALALSDRQVGVPSVVVEAPITALGRLARSVLDRLPGCTVIGVTGSVGKTSAKDLLAAIVSGAMPTVASAGSYNNEIGLPLTVLQVTEDTRALIVEMGARGLGHITTLTAIAPPTIGVVLNVGVAHLGEYGSVDVIAAAKGELVEALPTAADHGVAVLNADDPLVRAMAARTSARVVLVGRSAEADVRAEDVHLLAGAHPAFSLVTPEGSARVNMAYVGEHHVANALAAAAVARELGLTVDVVAAALSQAAPMSRWRMEVVERHDGVTVINDAYNASPDSVRAALAALVGLAAGRRTWAVLGEMRELGEQRDDLHAAIGGLVAQLDVDRLVVVGEEARSILLGATAEKLWLEPPALVAGADAAIDLLDREVRAGDVVLIKASRSIGLERVAGAMLATEGVRS